MTIHLLLFNKLSRCSMQSWAPITAPFALSVAMNRLLAGKVQQRNIF